jgi:uncharacterized LabA/DUF88 family protein
MKTILFIDGRNFIHKLESVLESDNKNINFSNYNFLGLIDKVLKDIKIDKKYFYLGKLVRHESTQEKSNELIQKQRELKNHLEEQGFEVLLVGRVRGHIEKCVKGHETLIFKEKGVDVKISVDMVTFACDKKMKTAIIGSSDSDLQPAIRELEKRNIERIYLGFENTPNKGMTYTTNRTILIRNGEVKEFVNKSLF